MFIQLNVIPVRDQAFVFSCCILGKSRALKQKMLSRESSKSKALQIFNKPVVKGRSFQYCAIFRDFLIVQKHIKLHTLRQNLQHLTLSLAMRILSVF